MYATAPPRFQPLEWLAIAWVSTDADPAEVLGKVHALCALEPDRSEAAARVEALAGMAATIRSAGADRSARDLFKCAQAGFTPQHLQLLAESMGITPAGPIVIHV